MINASTSNTTRTAPGGRRLALVTVTAAIAAALVNAVIFLVGLPLGAFPADVGIVADMPMTLFPIVSLTIIAVLAAGGVFALLQRLTKRPARVFMVLAAVVLVVAAIPPFTIQGAPFAMIVALQLTHLTAAGIAVYAFTAFTAPR